MNEYEVFGFWKIYTCRVALSPTIILGPLSYLFLFNSEALIYKILGIVLIIPVFMNIRYFLKVLKTPTLKLYNNTIEVCNGYGKKSVVSPISSYSLVVSVDYLAFRQNDAQDIMVNMNFFTSNEWDHLVHFLKKQPFIKVIEGTSN